MASDEGSSKQAENLRRTRYLKVSDSVVGDCVNGSWKCRQAAGRSLEADKMRWIPIQSQNVKGLNIFRP